MFVPGYPYSPYSPYPPQYLNEGCQYSPLVPLCPAPPPVNYQQLPSYTGGQLPQSSFQQELLLEQQFSACHPPKIYQNPLHIQDHESDPVIIDIQKRLEHLIDRPSNCLQSIIKALHDYQNDNQKLSRLCSLLEQRSSLINKMLDLIVKSLDSMTPEEHIKMLKDVAPFPVINSELLGQLLSRIMVRLQSKRLPHSSDSIYSIETIYDLAWSLSKLSDNASSLLQEMKVVVLSIIDVIVDDLLSQGHNLFTEEALPIQDLISNTLKPLKGHIEEKPTDNAYSAILLRQIERKLSNHPC